jgi:hypothetical protein
MQRFVVYTKVLSLFGNYLTSALYNRCQPQLTAFLSWMAIRWMSNLVLLVGRYSPYYKCVHASGAIKPAHDDVAESHALKYEGCYEDGNPRDLPVLATQVSGEGVNPARCSRWCRSQGYKFAGIQVNPTHHP